MTRCKNLSIKESVHVADILRAHCRETEGGFAAYDDGWSDGKIAGMIGCTALQVANIRIPMIGKIRTGSLQTVNGLGARLAALDDTMRFVQELLEAHSDAISDLARRVGKPSKPAEEANGHTAHNDGQAQQV